VPAKRRRHFTPKLTCRFCGFGGDDARWRDYFCPRCKSHNDALYRSEHLARRRGKALSRVAIEQEYAEAGYAFTPGGILQGAIRPARKGA